MATPQEVITLWAGLSGLDPEPWFSVMEAKEEVHRLCRHPLPTLRAAGEASLNPAKPPTVRLSLHRWLLALGDVPPQPRGGDRKRAVGRKAYVTEPTAERPEALRQLLDRADREHRSGTVARSSALFDSATVARAVERLRERGLEQIDSGRAIRRPPRWSRAPGPSLVGAPQLVPDPVEVAVVALLSEKADDWMFVSRPDGRMFTHGRNGYSEEEDRFYIDGLSELVDAASGLILSHRAGAGGRVYFTDRYIECAACDRIMAWLGNAGARRVAFGRCEATSRR